VGYGVTQIWVGSNRVGLIGLEDIFREIHALGITDHQAITAELLARTRRSNYIPVSAEAEYGRAMLLAYRRFLGEDIPDQGQPLEIRVFGGD
jgi:hypothetical protein